MRRQMTIEVLMDEKNGEVGIIKHKTSTLSPIEEIAIFELLKKESIEKITKFAEINKDGKKD